MILCFPDLDTLRLAVTSAAVLPEVTGTAADVVLADDGRVFLDTSAKLPKKAAGELAKLGVTQSKSLPGKPLRVSCWLQVVPVQKNPAPPQPTPQQVVLFELPSAKDLPGMVAEMLRLGNDRQSFRWVASAADAADRRVLLRVIGPPYYTLLRAIDAITVGKGEPVRAYTEQAPRVWVELGYSHPFADRVAPPADTMLLVRHPREWAFLPEQPFQDVYDILKFDLPSPPVEWKAIDQQSKLAVPLSLVPGNAADTPELWVLRGDALDKLDEFVRESDDRTTQRLRFAVADAANGDRVVVLKVSGTRGSPPTVPLANAVGYRPHPSLPHLFIPVAARLHPQLRRDAVRQLLADDPDLVVWLHPTGGGQFVPESVPDSAFHPLEDWVDYVVEAAHAPLKEWIESVKFDFAHFVCGDDRQPKPKDPGKGPKPKGGDGDTRPLTPEKEAGKGGSRKAGPGEQPTAERFETAAEPGRKPNEWKVRREELQKRFLAVDGPLDHPDRVALWPQLAMANAGAGDLHEAALCWVYVVWEKADADAVRQWCRTEFPDTNGEITEAEFGRQLKQPDLPRGEVRRFAAAVCLLAARPNPPRWFVARLTDVQKFVEANEPKLPVRIAWLTASTLGAVSGADVLGLARMRDRLLQRLLERGLNPELDLPFFLRTAGLNDSERVRHVRDEAHALHHLVRAWAEAGAKGGAVPTTADGNPTAAYVDLLFAYGLAKLGETQAAAKLADAAKAAFDRLPAESKPGIAGRFLYKSFRHRVDQAANGQPTTGRLPDHLYAELGEYDKKSQGVSNSPFGEAHYAVSRMLEQSQILDLYERPDPYKKFTVDYEGELSKRLLTISRITDPTRLANEIRNEYRSNGRKADPKDRGKAAGVTDDQFVTLWYCLPLSARCGGEFAAEMIRLVPAALRQTYQKVADVPKKQGQLLERGLFLAGHFDHRDLVVSLVDAFGEVLAAAPADRKFELVSVVAGQSLRSLRKLGLHDQIDRLLQKLLVTVLGAGTLADLKAAHASRPDVWLKALASALSVAGGWLMFGLTDKATPILDAARAELFAPPGAKTLMQDNTRLAVAYATTVGQGDAEAGVKRLKDLFAKMPTGKITNGYTTAPYYSRSHLNVVEAVVLTLASDDFALGAAGRRWLEDDEYLVRRRIHRDMRAQLSGSEL